MKGILPFILLTVFCNISFAEKWTTEQLEKANTAKDISYLTLVEKEAIMYINLARLYPKTFVQIEVKNYFGTAVYGDYVKNSSYRKSLMVELNTIKPLSALKFDKALYENAKCFSKESGESGLMGHERKKCKKANYSECCSYGMTTGKDIAMQWLIDDGIPELGHRKICLDKSYTKIGLSVHTHKQWGTCAVAELIW